MTTVSPPSSTSRADRLRGERNIWLATVRPDGRPQLTPIWFVFISDRLWVCTMESAVKTRNIRANAKVSFALENGNAPVTGEGTATVRTGTPPREVVDAFVTKFDWDITTDAEYQALIEIAVDRWIYPGEVAVT